MHWLSSIALALILSGTGLAQNTITKSGTPAITFKKIHNFDSANGQGPAVGLIADAVGNFYGTTEYGGAYGEGVVYELSPTSNGGWMESVLYSFGSMAGDGMFTRSKVTMDPSGNLYGTTPLGGAFGQGTVFQLMQSSPGAWTETVLYNFGATSSDGITPLAGVIIDVAGNLYGTTSLGGTKNEGTVYELTPALGGGWTETKLHDFGTNQGDGIFPLADLVFDAQGNLYGTTQAGGQSHGNGTVFQLAPAGGGAWTETILHSFLRGEGYAPSTAVTFDVSGNLYLSLSLGGMGFSQRAGTVYELSPNAGGGWTGTVLYYFQGKGAYHPESSVAIDGSGNLFVCTESFHSGAVVELMPAGDGTWNETIIHDFRGPDGVAPVGSLLIDSSGNIYGTTASGGLYSNDVCGDSGCGAVFEITP